MSTAIQTETAFADLSMPQLTEAPFQRVETKSALHTELESMIGKTINVEYGNNRSSTGKLEAVLTHGDGLSMKLNRVSGGEGSFIVNYGSVQTVSEVKVNQPSDAEVPLNPGLPPRPRN